MLKQEVGPRVAVSCRGAQGVWAPSTGRDLRLKVPVVGELLQPGPTMMLAACGCSSEQKPAYWRGAITEPGARYGLRRE